MTSRAYSIVERILWLVAVAMLPLFAFYGVRELDAASARQAAAFRTVLSAEPSPFSLPYFSRAGAWALERFGDSENSARLAAQAPALLASLIVLFWVWRRVGWTTAFFTALLFAASPWRLFFGSVRGEAALAAAAGVVAISAYERYWRAQIGWWKRLAWIFSMLLGLAAGGAAMGFFGLSLWLGTLFSLFAAFLLSERSFARLVGSLLTSPAGLVACALAPAWYAWRLVSGDALPDAAVNAFRDAAASNHSAYFTGEWSFADWKPFHPFVVFAWENVAWLWMIPGAWLLLFTLKTRREELPSKTWAWTANVLAFLFAGGTLASFRGREEAAWMMRAYLPLLLPLAGLFLATLAGKFPRFRGARAALPRWALLLAGVAWVAYARTRELPDRLYAQLFVRASERLNRLPPDCELWVAEGAVSEEDMDALGAWYFRNRPWFFTKKRIPSPIALPDRRVFWDIESGEILGRRECAP